MTLCDASGMRGASWGDDDTIVFTPAVNSGLWRIAATGGTPVEVTKLGPDERTHRWPHVLPGGHAVLFTVHRWSINYDDAEIHVVVLKTGERKLIRRAGLGPQFVRLPDGSGRLLYLQKGTLLAAAFDPLRLETRGDYLAMAHGILNSPSVGAAFAASIKGAMIYAPGQGTNGTLRIFWADQSARREPIHDVAGTYFTPRVSPDGKRVAFSAATSSGFEIRVKDLERDTTSRLSFLEGSNQSPVWTPDGQHIVFRSFDQPNKGLYWVRADGGGVAQRLTDGADDEVPYSFSPDGNRLAFSGTGVNRSSDIFIASIEGDRDRPKLGAREALVATTANEVMPAFSPDGRWLAYGSDGDSGELEVYVRPSGNAGGRWQISTGGGMFPVWSRRGELLFRAPDRHILAVDWTARSDSFVAGKVRRWSEVPVPAIGNQGVWDLTPDGKRMVAVLPEWDEQSAFSRLVLLINFTDEVQRRTAQ